MGDGVNEEQRPRFITQDFCLLFLACLITYAIYFLMITTMARYAIVAYGVAESFAGLAASIFFIGSMVSRLVTGRYTSKFALKKIALFGLTIMLVANILYLVATPTLWSLILVRILHGISFGCASSVIPAIFISTLPKRWLGTGTGYFALSITLGTAFGPLVGLLVTGGFDYNVLFGVCIGAVVVAIIAVLFVRGGSKAAAPSQAGGASKQLFTISSMIERRTVWISAYMLIICLAYSSYNAYMNTYAISVGLEFFAPFSFTVYGLALIVLRPFAGRRLDKRGDNAVIIPAILSQGIGLALLALIPNPVTLITVGVFMALGFGTMMSPGEAIVTKLVSPNRTALAITTFFLFCDLGAGLGPYLLGLIIPAAGYQAMYLIAAGFTLIAVVYYVLVHGRKAKALSLEERPTD